MYGSDLCGFKIVDCWWLVSTISPKLTITLYQFPLLLNPCRKHVKTTKFLIVSFDRACFGISNKMILFSHLWNPINQMRFSSIYQPLPVTWAWPSWCNPMALGGFRASDDRASSKVRCQTPELRFQAPDLLSPCPKKSPRWMNEWWTIVISWRSYVILPLIYSNISGMILQWLTLNC